MLITVCYLFILAAVIFRYNLISFSYLLLLLIIFLLPGPRLKAQKGLEHNVDMSPILLMMWPRLGCTCTTIKLYSSPYVHILHVLYTHMHGCLLVIACTELT